MIQGFQGCADPVAVFVDGDNLSHDHAEAILAIAAQQGRVCLSRVYGDITRLPDWDRDCRFAVQHATSLRGRNNADMRLVIDAMEHALAGRARVFVIASNDSDFGPLAARLCELGLVVVGVGGAQASRGFEAACSQFMRVQAALPMPKRAAPKLDKLDELLRDTIAGFGKAGQISLALLGAKVGKQEKPETYGAANWRSLLRLRADRFILEGSGSETMVRLHPAAGPPG